MISSVMMIRLVRPRLNLSLPVALPFPVSSLPPNYRGKSSSEKDGSIRPRNKDAKKKRKFLDFNPQPENPEQKDNLERFLALEQALERGLDRSRLTEQDWAVHRTHQEAVQDFQLMYTDPISGLQVFTRLRHFLKNRCCGSACRHCVYDHVKVKPNKKATREFNTAFWQDKKPPLS
ncbi:uncharacterized protein LOC131876928 [Tigriopus californicus]|uniref:uncharacterized protein LOC131876928 n=1 Tax=Tigriopus californicus TaxID=6832 RepID=UPI0027DA1E4A|nr:uncharacterized protein LOC131876928 [Tigriopus californicus]